MVVLKEIKGKVSSVLKDLLIPQSHLHQFLTKDARAVSFFGLNLSASQGIARTSRVLTPGAFNAEIKVAYVPSIVSDPNSSEPTQQSPVSVP